MTLRTISAFSLVYLLTTPAMRAETAPTTSPAATPSTVTKVPVVFSGGRDTDPRDHGRPVSLVAGALGVTSDVFRKAFGGVHPAGPDSGGPTGDEARKNKAALMSVLSPYGITNERLDEVSNRYRYAPGSAKSWPLKAAAVNALVSDGVVTGYEIVSGGYGYSSAPVMTVPGVKSAPATVEIAFAKDFETNGAVSKITIATTKAK